MPSSSRPGFIRLFVAGFTIGAVALVGVQVAQHGPQSLIAPASAEAR